MGNRLLSSVAGRLSAEPARQAVHDHTGAGAGDAGTRFGHASIRTTNMTLQLLVAGKTHVLHGGFHPARGPSRSNSAGSINDQALLAGPDNAGIPRPRRG